MWEPLVKAARRGAAEAPPLLAIAAASAAPVPPPPRHTLADVEAADEDLCSKANKRELPEANVAPSPAAMRAMFTFAAVTPASRAQYRGNSILPPGLRYRPEDVPLASIETSELVGVFRDTHGDLYAYSRVAIPRGTLIGWYVCPWRRLVPPSRPHAPPPPPPGPPRNLAQDGRGVFP